ncbi:MAG: hypothetical protein IJ225_07275 [Solobacterium sp.]|nr:hypothetical protein [Solobacterium sp.]
MQCKRCGKSIPELSFKCPYCGKRTQKGWEQEGKKALKPITDIVKKIKPY